MRNKAVAKAFAALIVIGGGIGYFVYEAMQSSWSYYYSVDDFVAYRATQGHSFRLAGRVKPGSVARDVEPASLRFTLAGAQAELPVLYRGIVPDNFVEDR